MPEPAVPMRSHPGKQPDLTRKFPRRRLGYAALLMPDVPQWQPAPAPTLAYAAAQADLHVGTWVYASPLRPAWSTAWEAHSLSVLPADPVAAAEEIQRRREEIGCSYFVFGADFAGALAPVVARLAGQ